MRKNLEKEKGFWICSNLLKKSLMEKTDFLNSRGYLAIWPPIAEAYSKFYQTSKMECFEEIVED